MMWLLMQAEFLGITLVVVYVGAVMVLFLFVVMMLNIDVEEMRQGFWRHAPAALVVGVLMAALLIAIFLAPDTALNQFGLMKDIPADYSNVRDLGKQIYTAYLLPFKLAAVYTLTKANNVLSFKKICRTIVLIAIESITNISQSITCIETNRPISLFWKILFSFRRY